MSPHNKLQGKAEKTIAQLVSKMPLNTLMTGITESSVSIGNIRRQYKKPLIPPDVKEVIYYTNRHVCEHVDNHTHIINLGYSCVHCEGIGYQYKAIDSKSYAKSALDISHSREGSWSLHMDESAYLLMLLILQPFLSLL